MPVTIQDIAEKVGVSRSTVSRAISGRGRIGRHTRAAVIAAARELGYVGTDEAIEPLTIGIVFNNRLGSLVGDPFYGPVIAGLEAGLSSRQHSLYFHAVETNSGADHLFSGQQHTDGFFFVGADINTDLMHAARQRQIPFVLVDNDSPLQEAAACDAVVIDNRRGAYQAIVHLLSLGHTRIGYLGGPREHSSFVARWHGAKLALSEYGIPWQAEMQVFDTAHSYGPDAGYELMHRLLRLMEPPTAVMADNDLMAIGALKAAYEHGLTVPTDLSVVGFDDIQMAAHAHPPLTTVQVPKEQIGAMAAARLLEIMAGMNMAPIRVACTARLIIRSSTRPPAGQGLHKRTGVVGSVKEVNVRSSQVS